MTLSLRKVLPAAAVAVAFLVYSEPSWAQG
jgi:hypothetical protein